MMAAATQQQTTTAPQQLHTAATNSCGTPKPGGWSHLGLGAGEEKFLTVEVAMMGNESVRSSHGALYDIL